MSVPTPIELKKGSSATIRRQVYLLDYDTGSEVLMDISPSSGDVDDIKWELFRDLATGTSAVMDRKKSDAEITYFSDGVDGKYEFTIDAPDIAALDIGLYKGLLTITKTGKLIEFRAYPVSVGS